MLWRHASEQYSPAFSSASALIVSVGSITVAYPDMNSMFLWCTWISHAFEGSLSILICLFLVVCASIHEQLPYSFLYYNYIWYNGIMIIMSVESLKNYDILFCNLMRGILGIFFIIIIIIYGQWNAWHRYQTCHNIIFILNWKGLCTFEIKIRPRSN